MPRVLTGKVVSLAMQNTGVVEIVWKRPHPVYRKLLKRSKTFKVDLAGQQVAVGDTVKITETRKLAKDKYFTVSEVVRVHTGEK